MAWHNTLLPASFRGVEFDVVATDDAAERAVAVSQYPYLDGGDTEDLGRGPRQINIEAVFFDGPVIVGEGDARQERIENDYENRLQAFVAALEQPGSGELVHPVFGAVEAQLKSWKIIHKADAPDACVLSLAFLEAIAGRPFFDQALPAQKAEAAPAHGARARSAFAAQLGAILSTIRAPLAQLDGLRQQMLGPVVAGMQELQGFVRSATDVLAFPRAWAGDLDALTLGLIDAVNFPGNVAAAWRSLTGSFAVFDTFFGRSAAPVSGAASVAQGAALVSAYTQVSVATALADGAAAALATEAAAPTLSPVELEAIANASRAALEAAIEAVRAILPVEGARPVTEPMKDQALAIQEAARAVIEARPPMVVRTLTAPGNLRLIAHRWYGDHTRAPELARLNPALRSPNSLGLGDTLNAYAR